MTLKVTVLALVITLAGCSRDSQSLVVPSSVNHMEANTAPAAYLKVDQEKLLGGLDLDGYCRSQGHVRSGLIKPQIGPGNAHGNWRCIKSNGELKLVVMSDACQWQYPYVDHPRAKAQDNNDAFTWSCYSR